MEYYKKYLKYKSKYLELKNQLGGNPSDYYFHGTNSAYLPYIKSGGLGVFHEDLYQRIKYIYEMSRQKYDYIKSNTIRDPLDDPISEEEEKVIRETKHNSFDDLFPDNYYENDRTNESAFINDQESYRKNHTYLTFFTSDIEQAKSYGIGENSIGNFLTGFLLNLKKWIERNKSDASKVTDLQRAIELKQILEPEGSKQIILAIRKDSLRPEHIESSVASAIRVIRLIRPEEIFLYNLESNTFTPIL